MARASLGSLGVMTRRWDWIGGALGLTTSAVDLWMFGGWGLDLAGLRGSPLGWAILASFVVGYTALGFALGRLYMARARALADAARIQRQLDLLEQRRAELAQSEKLAAIGRLAAGIAHEVRNPLGVIRASASIVREGLDEGTEDHRACELIEDEIDRLDGLIGALLAFARPARLTVAPTALGPVFDRAVALARESTALEVEVPDVPAQAAEASTVQADADLLTQLVLGLLVNASEAGARRAEVRASMDPERARLEVADDGPGVEEEVRGRVFEPFFTTKASGTGLGLAMAQRIVEAHGGRIAVDADPALGGARFMVELPRGGPAALTEAA